MSFALSIAVSSLISLNNKKAKPPMKLRPVKDSIPKDTFFVTTSLDTAIRLMSMKTLDYKSDFDN